MTKVAVTGGAGFIGSNLVSRLISMGHEVVVVDDLSTGLKSNLEKQDCEFHHCSITDTLKLENSISSCEVIFHLAARGSVPRSIKNPRATHDVNATGTLNILEIARASGAHVIFSSSSSVYGRNLQLPKDEAMWLGPLTPYAASKLAAEGYVEAYGSAYGVPVTILRFFNVFGPNQRPDHEYAAVLPKWIWLALNDQPINVFGDGSASRDFTYIETVIDIAISAMNEKIVTRGAVNLAYGNKISLYDVVNLLKRNFPDLKVEHSPTRLGDVKESQNNPSLIKELFPRVNAKPFDQAFEETVDWLRNFGETVANGPVTAD
jgi:UDP-glucose 4-epimerase